MKAAVLASSDAESDVHSTVKQQGEEMQPGVPQKAKQRSWQFRLHLAGSDEQTAGGA